MEAPRKLALCTVCALVPVWMMTPATAAEPVQKPSSAPPEFTTDKDNAELPEV